MYVRSGSGSCSVGLTGTLVSPPKKGISVEAPQVRAGVRSTRWTTRVSPGSAPSIQNGPVCGLRSSVFSAVVATSAVLVMRPPYASSVHSVSTVGGVIRRTGAAPPNV